MQIFYLYANSYYKIFQKDLSDMRNPGEENVSENVQENHILSEYILLRIAGKVFVLI